MSDAVKSRGRDAAKPTEIPARGWKDVMKRVKDQLGPDHTQIVSAGIAFYFFLALFPALAAFLSIYGLVVEPATVQSQMSQLTSVLPQQVHDLIAQSLERLSAKGNQALGWGLVISVLLSLWSTKKGTAALFQGVSIAYNEEEGRGFLAQTGLVLLFTLGVILLGVLSLGLVLVFPALAGRFGLPELAVTAISWGRWLLLGAAVVLALGALYRVAPHRSNPRTQWVTWGAGIATALWLVASLAFSWFVNSFGSYGEMYGSFAAVVILMLWFFITAFVILLGAEINAELEHQTSRDSTVGADQPMGERGAWHADHLPEPGS